MMTASTTTGRGGYGRAWGQMQAEERAELHRLTFQLLTWGNEQVSYHQEVHSV